MSSKQQLRSLMLEQREALDTQFVDTASTIICTSLKRLTTNDMQQYHVYSHIPSRNEVSVDAYASYLSSQGRQVYVQDWSADFPETQFDVIIVPCVAVDGSGNRIGYGGGNYDRFISGQDKPYLIGICFEQQVVEHIDSEPHDQPLDCIVTEASVRVITPL